MLLVNLFEIITVLFGALLILLMLQLLITKNNQLRNTGDYTKGSSDNMDREGVLKTLAILQEGYEKRDLTKIDFYFENTMSKEGLLILGTNPKEIFVGTEAVKKLLYGDWKYWGKVKFNLEEAHITQYSNVAYFVTGGEVKIHIWKIRFPLRVTGIMIREDSKWFINKLQFQYDFNTNYIIFSMLASIGLLVSLILFMVSLVIK